MGNKWFWLKIGHYPFNVIFSTIMIHRIITTHNGVKNLLLISIITVL